MGAPAAVLQTRLEISLERWLAQQLAVECLVHLLVESPVALEVTFSAVVSTKMRKHTSATRMVKTGPIPRPRLKSAARNLEIDTARLNTRRRLIRTASVRSTTASSSARLEVIGSRRFTMKSAQVVESTVKRQDATMRIMTALRTDAATPRNLSAASVDVVTMTKVRCSQAGMAVAAGEIPMDSRSNVKNMVDAIMQTNMAVGDRVTSMARI